MARRAEHLGMSSLDTDTTAEREEADEAAARAAGWAQVPRGLRRKKTGVREALGPEQAAMIRLAGLTAEVLDVLAEVEWAAQATEVRCLAWAYLALMLVPDVPKAWLRDTMRANYGGLCDFIEQGTRQWFPHGAVEALPWAGTKAQSSVVAVSARFANGLIFDTPGVGEAWQRWWARRRKRTIAGDASAMEESATVEILRYAGAGLTLLVSALLWRRLPQLGAPVQTWQRPLPGLLGMGAASVMLGRFSDSAMGGDPWR